MRIRASSRPCSFFAAWYSKFSERSPKLRAVAIAWTTSARFGPSSSASSASSCSFWALGQVLDSLPRHRGRVTSGVEWRRMAARISIALVVGLGLAVLLAWGIRAFVVYAFFALIAGGVSFAAAGGGEWLTRASRGRFDDRHR